MQMEDNNLFVCMDSRDMTFKNPADKLEKVKVRLRAVRASGTCRVREGLSWWAPCSLCG